MQYYSGMNQGFGGQLANSQAYGQYPQSQYPQGYESRYPQLGQQRCTGAPSQMSSSQMYGQPAYYQQDQTPYGYQYPQYQNQYQQW